MRRLQHIIRIRITDEQKALLADKKISTYIREALEEKMLRDGITKSCPF